VEEQHPRFIDTEEASSRRVRGVITAFLATKAVNRDEKGNMCDWLCENGTRDDFANFSAVFQMVEDLIG
jgi:hypothetical protein